MTQQPTPPGAQLNLRGAVDLGALAARNTRREEVAARRATDPDATAPARSPFVVDVTEATFTDVVQRSVEVPVLLDLWAEGYDQGAEDLQTLVDEYAGAFLLGRIDAQAEPQLAQSLVQSLQAKAIPLVAAIVKGQPIPLFTGSYPSAEEIRPVLEEVLRVAEANGVTGRLEGGAERVEEPAAPPVPPLHAEALAAVAADDFDAAAAAWQKALANDPRDAEAIEGLARVGVLRRVHGVDLASARAGAAAAPDDVAAQLVVADLDLVGGHVEDAFARLLSIVQRTAGAERELARTHLVELFAVVGAADPRVVKARTALSRALF